MNHTKLGFAILVLTFLITCNLVQTYSQFHNSSNENSKILIAFTDFYDFKNQFQKANDTHKTVLISDYLNWQRSQGFPAILNTTHVVFIYYSLSEVASVSIAGDFNGWTPAVGSMVRLDSGYNFFYRGYNFESDARLDYKFVVGSNWILDPENPNRVAGGFGDNSELAMPIFVQPAEIVENAFVSHGQLTTITTNFPSVNPVVKVYTPPNYALDDNFSVVYFTDGSEYINLGSAINILDNLIYQDRITPIIAVFTDPYPSVSDRHLWYNCQNTDYVDYITLLVNHIDENYKTNTSSTARLHIGDSLGGQISVYLGLVKSDLFKNIGSHSGAFWDGSSSLGSIGCDIKQQVENVSASLNLKMFFTAGKYESTIFMDTRAVQTSVHKKGWTCKAMYLNEGHSWGQWRHTLDNMLEFYFSPIPTEDTCELPPPLPEEPATSMSSSSSDMITSISDQPTTSESELSSDGSKSSTKDDASLSFISFFFPLLLIGKVRN
ncbi:MAG: alpha/beta hydrolase-fold protein, partial [Candidatus Kariarchaeaceae archaeon]